MIKKIIIIILLLVVSASIFAQSYKVGVFDNPPMAFMEDGEAKGFFIELLQHVADKNEWELTYYPCAFSDCMEMLEANTIDILPDLGHSVARDSIFVFNETSIISTWAEVYYANTKKNPINDIMGLKGLKVAGLDGDYFYKNGNTGLIDLSNELGLNINVYMVGTYAEAMRLTENGTVDAAYVSKIFGDYNAYQYDVVKSQIMISHLSLRYGVSKSNVDAERIKKAIDKEVRLQISDENSLYYLLKQKYFIGSPVEVIPKWLWQIVLSLIVVVGILIIASLLLRYQVERKTRQLKETNKILRTSEHEAKLALNTIEASSDLAFWGKPGKGLFRVNDTTLKVLGYTSKEIQALPTDKLIVSEDYGDYLKNIKRAKKSNPHMRFETEAIKKNGEKIPIEVSLDQFEFEGVTYVCGFARDISERKKAIQQRQELMSHLAEQNKALNCLYDVSKLTSDTHNSIEEILQKAVELIPLSWFYSDIACAKITCSFGDFFSNNFKESKWKIKAPIIINDGNQGELVVFYKKEMLTRSQFSFEERNLIDTLGELLGNMLNVKGAEQEIIATIMNTEDRERTRISKEVHDSLGQTLSAIALNMDKVNQEISLLGKKEQKRLINLNKLINQAVIESRNIAHNLMPSTLSDFGFLLAVENMIETLKDATETRFNFYTNYKKKGLEKSAELGLYRITQEAVNNIMKHAQAKNVTIQLMCYPDIIILTIEDDGIGFDLKNTKEISRFGLNSMENRARSLNAEFSLDSEVGKGTVITLQIHTQ